MRSRIFSSLTLSVYIACVSNVGAYELATHGSITNHAFGLSVLNGDYLVNGLGIINSVDLFGLSYYDVSGSNVSIRDRDSFENSIIETDLKLASESLTLKGWLMRGAIREDDHPTTDIAGCYKKSEHPQDDPYNDPDLTRPLNLFFDPVNDRPLSKLAGWVALGERAPHWALGSTDPFTAPNTADTERQNHFTVFDAREAMYRALTGMNKAGSKAIGVGGVEPSSAEDKEAMRKAYWATTFRALGDVVHLIQDMAQPQHTRNDAHAGACGAVAQEIFTGHESAYELRVDSRALGAVPNNNLDYDSGYPRVLFNEYAAYFSTRHLDAFAARRGIADYSNREFLSVGTNIGSYRYSSPSNNRDDYQTELISDHKGVVASYLTRTVTDNRRPEATAGVKMAHESLFKAFLDPGDNFPVDPYEYTMNNDIYDAQANLLIPRAVAYSAGLIDYFFRGRMEISLPNDGVYAILDHAVEKEVGDGFRRIKLKLYNSTPAINDGQSNHPQDMTDGTLRAVVKFQRNGCYQPDLFGEPGLTGCDIDANRGPEEIVVSNALTIQALTTLPELAQEFVFDFSTTPIPVNAVNVSLQVVYRGILGSEIDAVIVATKDISEPTFFSYVSRGSYFSHFQFGGGSILGTANATARGSRFAVLIENGPITYYFRDDFQTVWTSSDDVEIFQPTANLHQYNPQTDGYDIRFLNSNQGVYVNYGFVGHVNAVYGYDPDAPPLNNLTPYPIQLYF